MRGIYPKVKLVTSLKGWDSRARVMVQWFGALTVLPGEQRSIPSVSVSCHQAAQNSSAKGSGTPHSVLRGHLCVHTHTHIKKITFSLKELGTRVSLWQKALFIHHKWSLGFKFSMNSHGSLEFQKILSTGGQSHGVICKCGLALWPSHH